MTETEDKAVTEFDHHAAQCVKCGDVGSAAVCPLGMMLLKRVHRAMTLATAAEQATR